MARWLPVLFVALLPACLWAQGTGMSVAFHDAEFHKVTTFLTNGTQEALKVAKPDQGWGPAFSVFLPDGSRLRQTRFVGRAPDPGEDDFLPIAPGATLRLEAGVAPFHTLDAGALYFVTVKYNAFLGPSFMQTFPYGRPQAQPALDESGEKRKLVLSAEFPDPTYRKVTFVLRNTSDKAVQVVSEDYFTRHLGHSSLALATSTGEKLSPIGGQTTTPPPPPTEKDLLTIGPNAVHRVTLDISQYYKVDPEKLYVLSINYWGFAGSFPYGMPKAGMKVAE